MDLPKHGKASKVRAWESPYCRRKNGGRLRHGCAAAKTPQFSIDGRAIRVLDAFFFEEL